MKKSDGWYNVFLANKSPEDDLKTIEQIQLEAWNEAIKAASESATVAVYYRPITSTTTSSPSIRSCVFDKQSILKLLK